MDNGGARVKPEADDRREEDGAERKGSGRRNGLHWRGVRNMVFSAPFAGLACASHEAMAAEATTEEQA